MENLKDRGWYWLLLDGYDFLIPCQYFISDDKCYFLAAGLGDSSSSGIYMEDIKTIGPEIIEPKL